MTPRNKKKVPEDVADVKASEAATSVEEQTTTPAANEAKMDEPELDFAPTTDNVNAVLNDPENYIPFGASSWHISLPWTAFFDQELGAVIFEKLMKAPVKDYQVLLRLSKLWKTINDISRKLSHVRDAISKDCGLDDLVKQEAAMTPEMLNSPVYQAKSRAFGAMIQQFIFAKTIDLAPLWTLTLDLTNPDGHAKAFIEWSNLSMDDIEMLDNLEIIKVIYPEEKATPVEGVLQTEEQAAEAEEQAQQAENDVLVPDENKDEQN